MPDAQSILAPLQIPKNVKADAWDAFESSTNEDDLATRLKGMPLANNVRAALWDAKHAQQSGARTSTPPDFDPRTGGNVPGVPTPPLPAELQQPTNQPGDVGMGGRNPRTGARYDSRTRVPVLDAPIEGVQQIVHGAEAIAGGNADRKAHGVSQIIRGAGNVVLPVALPLAAAAPVVAAGAAATGMLGQAAGQKIAEAAGAGPGASELAGDITGLAAGAAGGAAGNAVDTAVRGAGARMADAAGGIADRVIAPKPLSAEAKALADKLNIPLTRGMQGGSPALQGVERTLGKTVANDMYMPRLRQSQEGLVEGAKELSGGFATDRFSAGATTAKTLLDRAQDFHDTATGEYANLKRLEADPANVKDVTVGTKLSEPSGLVDASGRPVSQPTQVPVTETVGLPTDLRPVKRAVEPLVEDVSRRMDAASRRADPGLAAIENILTRPDTLPASVAEADLGYLKSIGRSDASPQAKRLAAIAVDALEPQIDHAVSQAGPEALQSLQNARSSWRQHAELVDLVKKLSGDKTGEEGQVRLANSLLQPADAAFPKLEKVLAAAPDAAQDLGKAYLAEKVFKGSAEGDTIEAQKAKNLWNQIGPRTKAALYTPEQISNISNFLEIAKRVNDGAVKDSGQLAMLGKLGLLVVNPVKTGVAFAFGRTLAKYLYSPEGGAALNTVMEAPASEAAASAMEALRGTGKSGAPVPQTASPRTTVDVPGGSGGYAAQYEVRELAEIQPSHNGLTFQPNPTYQIRNDRNYDNPLNQAKIVEWSGKGPRGFKSSHLVNSAPDASSGPPVIDSTGNVLGGNGRTMILQRVLKANGDGAQSYRAAVDQAAQQFGIDPASYAHMKHPVLVRVVDDADLAAAGAKQNAITDFNKSGTAALTPNERSIADSRRVSPATFDDVGRRLDDLGANGTLAQVLEGQGGRDIIGRLVDDGVITSQERAALITKDGLTKAGRDRISNIMLGRFFNDPAQMDKLPPVLRNKMERIAAPLARTEGAGGFDLTAHMRDAIDLLEEADAHGASTIDDFLAQNGLYGYQENSPEAVVLAKKLLHAKPLDLVEEIRNYTAQAKYAREYQGPGMFGDFPDPATPKEAFEKAFGKAAKK